MFVNKLILVGKVASVSSDGLILTTSDDMKIECQKDNVEQDLTGEIVEVLGLVQKDKTLRIYVITKLPGLSILVCFSHCRSCYV